ncbi:MAG: DEAD/DEAH box helicase [Candidatus Thorarchaeota archaeon]|nr:DEAD/DEAH box helicase [Candidatus Thorarchaeota archaeon]
MTEAKLEETELDDMRSRLRALGNRYAIEILEILSPESGDIIPNMGWDQIIEGILELMGTVRPKPSKSKEKSGVEAEYERNKKKFAAGGTLYESMNKLVKAGYVLSKGSKGKKQRTFMITHEGRLALSAVDSMLGPTSRDTEVYRTAKTILRHKNFIRLLPAQEKFLDEVTDFDSNIIIQMPPGSGKTFLAMVAILIKLEKGIKCLYLSPYISIITQVINEYAELFEDLGYSVIRHDGTTESMNEYLMDTDLVVGVYESVFSDILRNDGWTKKIGLTIVDELTELDSPIGEIDAGNLGTDRSAKLDCMITLLKRKSQIITLSSRFGETEEVERWLDARVFRPSVRMNPDEYIVTREEAGIQIVSSDGTQNVLLQKEHFLESIIEHMGDYENKSVLIVASSRNKSEWLAGVISRHFSKSIDSDIRDQIIGTKDRMPVASQLRELLPYGVAFHHAGLGADVRIRLEEMIKSGKIRTVVSTTGITAGISFPFDCVIILFDRIMDYLAARSRYLQVAGRIGEYHLAKNGGSVYLVFEAPSRRFQDSQSLEETLLHRPLEALNPGPLFPSILANLMTRQVANGREFTKEKLKDEMMKIAHESFRATQHKDYPNYIKKMFSTLFSWLVKKKGVEATEGGFKLSEGVVAASRSGLDIIRYLEVQGDLDTVENVISENVLVDLILSFGLPQIIRPRTSYPTNIELRSSGLEDPSDWYNQLTRERNKVKIAALAGWIEELEAPHVIDAANEIGRNIVIDGRDVGGLNMDEGDFDSLIGICSRLAGDLSQYFSQLKKTDVSTRFHIFSRQLRFGVKSDLAETDLLEMQVQISEEEPIPFSKQNARILHNNGYSSISDILRKDRDPDKKGLARDRFAKNSGLEEAFAKEVYKAALAYVRAKLDDDED